MIPKKSPLLVILILVAIFLSSCTTLPPPLSFDETYLNNQVILHALKQENTFRTKDTLLIRMTFNTKTDIVFPNNYNLRLFIEENDEWHEIYEQPRTRLPEGNFVFSPFTSHQFPGFYVAPALPDFDKKHLVRIYISGEMENEKNTKTVTSFIDVLLFP